MIGVIANEADLPWVAEFFELFKTPWEAAIPGKHYGAVLSNVANADSIDAPLTLIYGADELPIDRRLGVVPRPFTTVGARVGWEEGQIPLYGRSLGFDGEEAPLIHADKTALAYRRTCGTKTVQRFGYDLFFEVQSLLTQGQPKSNAASPTLELHIDLVRQCLRRSDTPFIEVPPRPDEYSFVCCLTHDVDFFGVRRHAGDSTLAGFVSRAIAGTAVDVLRGRRPLDEAFRNWLSVLSLPFVFLGHARDFWQPFEDYRRVEQGRSTTFFLIPFKGRPGVAPDGTSKPLRAAPYGISEIRQEIAAHSGDATEFAVHGIDAWRDPESGVSERGELTKVTGQQRPGVRMHWLYFSSDAPANLENAGFRYDSTWGYNDAVGYRAGTAQVFQFTGTRLLELPLTVMDTALFYFDRMGLSRRRALERCRTIIQQLRRFGGAFVVNWHDRSLAPERQWTRPYQALLRELDANGAWFATAGQAVAWFEWRRSIKFAVNGASQVRVDAPPRPQGSPAARVLVHNGGPAREYRFTGGTETVHV